MGVKSQGHVPAGLGAMGGTGDMGAIGDGPSPGDGVNVDDGTTAGEGVGARGGGGAAAGCEALLMANPLSPMPVPVMIIVRTAAKPSQRTGLGGAEDCIVWVTTRKLRPMGVGAGSKRKSGWHLKGWG